MHQPPSQGKELLSSAARAHAPRWCHKYKYHVPFLLFETLQHTARPPYTSLSLPIRLITKRCVHTRAPTKGKCISAAHKRVKQASRRKPAVDLETSTSEIFSNSKQQTTTSHPLELLSNNTPSQKRTLASSAIHNVPAKSSHEIRAQKTRWRRREGALGWRTPRDSTPKRRAQYQLDSPSPAPSICCSSAVRCPVLMPDTLGIQSSSQALRLYRRAFVTTKH